MGCEELCELDHDWVKDELEIAISDFVDRQFPRVDRINVKQEESIEIPYQGSRRMADVLIEFNDTDAIPNSSWRSSFRGCAFEVKTRCEDTKRGASQLYDYSRAGYQPILVAPGWLLTQERGYPRHTSGSFSSFTAVH